jgi:hypothetical protein
MKKLLFLIFINGLFISLCNAQSKNSELIAKIALNFKNYSPKGKTIDIFLNSKERILDISNYQIPLNEIKIKYKSDPKTIDGVEIEGYVVFECNKNCILFKNDYFLSIGYPFKNKKGAYETIEIINELLNELNR